MIVVSIKKGVYNIEDSKIAREDETKVFLKGTITTTRMKCPQVFTGVKELSCKLGIDLSSTKDFYRFERAWRLLENSNIDDMDSIGEISIITEALSIINSYEKEVNTLYNERTSVYNEKLSYYTTLLYQVKESTLCIAKTLKNSRYVEQLIEINSNININELSISQVISCIGNLLEIRHNIEIGVLK